MSRYFQDYLTVGFFAGLGVVLVMIMLGVASVLRPYKPSPAKASTYECGVDPVGPGGASPMSATTYLACCSSSSTWRPFSSFPGRSMPGQLGWFGLVEMGAFIFILLLGLIYAIRKGVLKWE